jgi:glycosyltransferase involved in cell wall biosynthesis
MFINQECCIFYILHLKRVKMETMRKIKKKPLVSVIIPTYNRARMIKEAVDSVLAQDFKDFELIVVDDGSTDNTSDVLSSYADDISIFYQENKGVSAARNRGIAEASGQFIAFLDSDDLWLPKKLTTQVEFFNQTPDALICQTAEVWIRNGIRVNPKKRHKKFSGIIFEPSLALCLVSPSAVMMRQELLDSAGSFDETLPVCEDYDLWLRISCRFPVYLIEIPLIIKRGGHDDQLSKGAGLDKFRIKAIEKIIKTGILSDGQHQAALNMLKNKCDIYAAGCRKRGREEEALYFTSLSEKFR